MRIPATTDDCSNEKEAQQLALSVGWRLADGMQAR